MKRRALIIYCDNTESGKLHGPQFDNKNFRTYLQSKLGGHWYENEILSLRNPKYSEVKDYINGFMVGSDYTFIVFTGHGYIHSEKNVQYIELSDQSISIINLRTNAKRQTLIVDACRGFYIPADHLLKGLEEDYKYFTGEPYSTREWFDNAILNADEGWTILFAASKNQTALDTSKGAAYLLTLFEIALLWAKTNKNSNFLSLKDIQTVAKKHILKNFATTQIPTINTEKRMRYYPFAVKQVILND